MSDFHKKLQDAADEATARYRFPRWAGGGYGVLAFLRDWAQALWLALRAGQPKEPK